jgi:NADH-quinone oxidoreductase subunit G
VSEAVLRYASEKLGAERNTAIEFHEVRGDAGIREATITAGTTELRLAIVNGLANARQLAEKVVKGEAQYDMIEVMACPGGCVGGAGQPVTFGVEARRRRAQSLYDTDRTMQLHNSQDNHMVAACYPSTSKNRAAKPPITCCTPTTRAGGAWKSSPSRSSALRTRANV